MPRFIESQHSFAFEMATSFRLRQEEESNFMFIIRTSSFPLIVSAGPWLLLGLYRILFSQSVKSLLLELVLALFAVIITVQKKEDFFPLPILLL